MELYEKYLTKIGDILELSSEELKQNCKKIDDMDAVYFYNPVRGGNGIIVSANGEYLAAGSAISFEKLVEEFKSGRRNGNLD